MTIQDADKAIRDAWIVGMLSFGVSVLLTMIYFTGAGLAHIAPLNIIELILLPALAYGIYRKSYPSAILMLVYHVGSKAWLWADEQAFIGLPLALIFAYFFWRGVQGTAVYHKTKTVPVHA